METPIEELSEELADEELLEEEIQIGMPVDLALLQQVRTMLTCDDANRSQTARLVERDPVLILEVLFSANGQQKAQAGRPTLTCQHAVVQLGSQQGVQLFDHLASRPSPSSPLVHEMFEEFRAYSRKVSMVARTLAEGIDQKALAEEAFTAGALAHTGHFVACMELGDTYVKLARDLARGKLIYHLQTKERVDLEKMRLKFLKKFGIPDSMLFVFDRDSNVKGPDRYTLRSIVETAVELVNAWEDDKWGKYAKENEVPRNSSLRLLRINSLKYPRVIESLTETLESIEKELDGSSEEENTRNDDSSAEEEVSLDSLDEFENLGLDDSLDDAPESQVDTKTGSPDVEASREEEPVETQDPKEEEKLETLEANDEVEEEAESSDKDPDAGSPEGKIEDEKRTNSKEDYRPRYSPERLAEELQLLIDDALDVGDLFSNLVGYLTEQAPFERAIVFSLDAAKETAKVFRSVCGEISEGQDLSISGPSDPLASATPIVKSFVTDGRSPLGAQAFAISPITTQESETMVLYVDCGDTGSITFEGRRVFRNLVDLLNVEVPKVVESKGY